MLAVFKERFSNGYASKCIRFAGVGCVIWTIKMLNTEKAKCSEDFKCKSIELIQYSDNDDLKAVWKYRAQVFGIQSITAYLAVSNWKTSKYFSRFMGVILAFGLVSVVFDYLLFTRCLRQVVLNPTTMTVDIYNQSHALTFMKSKITMPVEDLSLLNRTPVALLPDKVAENERDSIVAELTDFFEHKNDPTSKPLMIQAGNRHYMIGGATQSFNGYLPVQAFPDPELFTAVTSGDAVMVKQIINSRKPGQTDIKAPS